MLLFYSYLPLFSLHPDSLSSSSVTHIQSITTKVGNQAVLPCSWKSRLGEEALPTCHIQWATPVDTVFELRGEQKYEAEEFKGRVEVPEERLGSGDCSLIISDVQIGDTGRYESFMVVDGARTKKTRVFIQSIKLSVFGQSMFGSFLCLPSFCLSPVFFFIVFTLLVPCPLFRSVSSQNQ